jgi:hypothetical protein
MNKKIEIVDIPREKLLKLINDDDFIKYVTDYTKHVLDKLKENGDLEFKIEDAIMCGLTQGVMYGAVHGYKHDLLPTH